MAKVNNSHKTKEPSKAELQRRMQEARASISETVTEIKDTVEDQVQSVKRTVNGIVEWREGFAKDPIIWSLGAMGAGFALGYTLGYAHKNTKTSRGKQSEIAEFADSLIDELSGVSNSLVMPALNSRIQQLFGFDFSDTLKEISETRKRSRKRTSRKQGAKPSASRKVSARKKRAV